MGGASVKQNNTAEDLRRLGGICYDSLALDDHDDDDEEKGASGIAQQVGEKHGGEGGHKGEGPSDQADEDGKPRTWTSGDVWAAVRRLGLDKRGVIFWKNLQPVKVLGRGALRLGC